MTEIGAGVVDVHVVDPEHGFRVLMLRRADGVRCTGAWESVHGTMEAGESAEAAAVRELTEETGLPIRRLYSITVNPFYVPKRRSVQLAVVFCALVDSTLQPSLGVEHDRWEWLPYEEAIQRAAWPRTRQTLRDIHQLLQSGNAGPLEDVLRVL